MFRLVDITKQFPISLLTLIKYLCVNQKYSRLLEKKTS